MKLDNQRVHPQLRAPLDAMHENFVDIDNIEESRREVASFSIFVPLDTVIIEDRVIPGADGEPDVPVVIVTPIEKKEDILPGILYIHGGGYTCGSARETSIQKYADQINCVVVSVEYRRAPENVFPAALNDCYSALKWFYENAGQLGVDRSNIAVVGASAGGGLTAALALYARDK
ncbi:MAG: alpha/beta hydrolase, partial [Rikenellaceae bacterium]|nr:alpha/beta hydrolase [Rikenellaceae bacterium]